MVLVNNDIHKFNQHDKMFVKGLNFKQFKLG